MVPIHATKYLLLTPPAAKVDDSAFTIASIDAKGWDYCTILCILGDTDIAMEALKVGEADADSAHVDITGLVYGTSVNTDGNTSSLPTADSDNKIFAFEIDLRKRKRYIKVAATAGDGTAGTFMTVLAILSRGEDVPTTATERGLAQLLRV